MQVTKWGDSLAVRLPSSVVEALKLREGDDIEIQITGGRNLDAANEPDLKGLLARLRRFRGQLPADFRFDRLEAQERG